MEDSVTLSLPYDLWSLIVDNLIIAVETEQLCEECLIDTRMMIDLIQQVLDGEVKPQKDWVDTLDDYLKGMHDGKG